MNGISSIIEHLPPGWVLASIGEIFQITGGGTPTTQIPSYWEGQVPWITSADIHGLKDITPRKKITQEAIANSATHCVPKGSIIVATRVSLGKVGITKTDLCFSQDCQALLGQWDYINPDYCLYYLAKAVQIFKYENRGTTISGVTVKQLKELPIPIPPLQEQYRIVSKIEELFTQLDAGVAALEKVQAQLRHYRQTILKNAFEGRLTQEWRDQEGSKSKSAEGLINEIQHKVAPLQKKIVEKYNAVDTASLTQLPDRWIWVKLGQLSDMSAGKAFLKSEYSEKGVRLLQIANVSFGKIIWDDTIYLPSEYLDQYPHLSLMKGDMVIALNRPILSGKLKIGILSQVDVPSILYQRVGRFDLFDPALREYLFYFAQSPFFINHFKKSLQGIEIPFINKPVLLNTLVPLPPLDEQKIIVKEIERHLSIINEIEKLIEENLVRSNALRRSILKKAFEGKLVPQEPNDEPASVLLERIRAGKAKQKPEMKRGRKVRTTTQRRLIPDGE